MWGLVAERQYKKETGGRCGVSTTSLFVHVHVSVSLMRWALKRSHKSIYMYLKFCYLDIQIFSKIEHMDRFFFGVHEQLLKNRFL